MQTIAVACEGQEVRDVPIGTQVREVLSDRPRNGLQVLGALVNNDVQSLHAQLLVNATVEPLTLANPHGWDIFRRSLGFLLVKAAHEAMPASACRVLHAYGPGLFCTLANASGPDGLRREIARLKAAMDRLVADDLPITMECVSYTDALRMFEETGLTEKLNLLRHRNPPVVHLIRCGRFLDLAQAPLAHRTGLLKPFDLIPYDPGFVLHLPAREHPDRIDPLVPQPHLFTIYQEHAEWGRILGLTTVGQLNEAIASRCVEQFIQTAEALHEKKLASIAAGICARQPPVRLVLIAGPSSAGKTTFAKRLITHLRVNGLQPAMLSTDDYFVGDARNPRDEQGGLDYEHLEAVDLPRLNSDLARLLAGEEVRTRAFDFRTKTGADRPEPLRLRPNGVIVMEGIHALNPRLTAGVPNDVKYLVFVSALTQLGIDRNVRISTTDNRLMRRLVRDHAHRGHEALHTLRRWPSVRRGERRWIFPFQEGAHATFNSALDYELAVLKSFVVPLLNEVKPHHPEYAVARRLTGFLHNFMAIPPDAVPGYSILREYIGGSQLSYG
jgi:uridine kinase